MCKTIHLYKHEKTDNYNELKQNIKVLQIFPEKSMRD